MHAPQIATACGADADNDTAKGAEIISHDGEDLDGVNSVSIFSPGISRVRSRQVNHNVEEVHYVRANRYCLARERKAQREQPPGPRKTRGVTIY